MSRILFVYFDLDDTLLDHRGAERQALEDLYNETPEFYGAHELTTIQETYHVVNSDVWRRYGAGVISKERAKLERFENLLAALSVNGDAKPAVLSEHYMRQYAKYWSYVPGAKTAYLSIAATHPVGILTNGFVEVQQAKLGQFLELRERASAIVISEELGFMKPDLRIFQYAAEKACVSASEILYIGDSYRTDILGAQAAGWQVIWFATEGNKESDTKRFESWEAILDWFDEIKSKV